MSSVRLCTSGKVLTSAVVYKFIIQQLLEVRVRILTWKYENTSVRILAFLFIDAIADYCELLLFLSPSPLPKN